MFPLKYRAQGENVLQRFLKPWYQVCKISMPMPAKRSNNSPTVQANSAKKAKPSWLAVPVPDSILWLSPKAECAEPHTPEWVGRSLAAGDEDLP